MSTRTLPASAAWFPAVLALASALSMPAHAEEDEEFLLGDFGVRIDLPGDWKALEWSDWDFIAERDDRSLKLYAWGQPVQTPLTEDDLAAWSTVYVDKVAKIGGKNPSVSSTSLRTVAGRPVARFELSFDFGEDLEGVMSGASWAVEGRMFHMAIIAAAKRGMMASQALEQLAERAEVRKPPAATAEGATVEGAGVSVVLPPGWRTPLPPELPIVQTRADALGVEDLEPCWVALRPRPASEPDVLLTCQGGLLLGVVDAYSFADKDAMVRERLFGQIEVPPAQQVENLDGRLGFLYAPPSPGRTLRVGVVPYGDGIARTWALGEEGADEAFDAALRHVMTSADYAGDHPAGLGDQARHLITYRPTSPPVLGAVGGLVLLLVGGVIVMRRKGGDRYGDIA